MKKINVMILYRAPIKSRSTTILPIGSVSRFTVRVYWNSYLPCNGCISKIGPVHKTGTVQKTKSSNQPPINPPDNGFLLSLGELMDVSIV
jgi:hypothetical protein